MSMSVCVCTSKVNKVEKFSLYYGKYRMESVRKIDTLSVCVCVCVCNVRKPMEIQWNPRAHKEISSKFFFRVLKVPKMVIFLYAIWSADSVVCASVCLSVCEDCTTKSQIRNDNNVISIRLEKKDVQHLNKI